MTASANHLFWTIDDEPLGLQYHVRVIFERRELDPGDWTTPPCGGDVRILDLQVRQVRRFDDQGIIADIKLGFLAAKYAERAWELLETDPRSTRQLEEACLDHGGGLVP